ncbi:uncharacterized protein [Antennarius striatus]|uniref:uncharacterized protein isoform X2 n=1 Tax=Antennarius striatus TaxID=241820 RepID=UPI0035B1D679
MSTSGLQATNRQNVKELDSMKESISDIINQLQDIDPTRLSFSPFLDLDTQISLAPVSDSPESSMEELHSSSHSHSGSQRSLEPPPATNQQRSSAPCHQQSGDNPLEEPRGDQTGERELDQTLSSPIITVHGLDAAAENCIGRPTPASQGDIPNGTDTLRWSPGSTNLDSTMDEGRPLIGPPPESVELTVWSSEGRGETCEATEQASDQGRCCCQSMLMDAAWQFCTGSLHLQEVSSRGQAVQKLFVSASLEQLLLYVLNLVVMAALLPQEQLKLVPILVAMFVLGRLVYWVSLNTCSSWRGFGSGLTVFPLLAMVALNLFLIYTLNLKEPLFGSQDVLYNQVTPSSWSDETSQSPSGTPDILNAQ